MLGVGLFSILLGLGPEAVDSGGAATDGAQVTLEGQRGELDLSGARPQLRFNVIARNALALAVNRIEIGILFAATEDPLHNVVPGDLYRSGQGTAKVGVVRKQVEVSLAPLGRAVVEVLIELVPGQPDPQVFRTHVLGYRLAAVNARTLLELLGTEAAADEVAAVETLAVAGTAEEKRRARERWGSAEGLVSELADALRAPLPDRPGVEEVLRRVYAIRALGVLGGEEGGAALRDLLKSPALGLLDEPLFVLLSARLHGSRLETPTAFAVPVSARRMNDVVAAALDDVVEPKNEANLAVPFEPEGARTTTVADNGESAPAGTAGIEAGENARTWPWLLIGLLVALTLAAGVVWQARRPRGS